MLVTWITGYLHVSVHGESAKTDLSGKVYSAVQVPNCNNHRLKPAAYSRSYQPQSAMNSAYEYVLPSHLALCYKSLEMTASNHRSSSQCLVDEDLCQLSNTLTSFKHKVPEDLHYACNMPFPQSPRSMVLQAGSQTSMLAGKTEPALSTTSDYRASRCEQGPMQKRSSSAVIQRDVACLCALNASCSEGSTVVAAPYSVGSTSKSADAPQIDQGNSKSPISEANSADIAQQPSLQHCQSRHSFEISQDAQPVWGNRDSQNRSSDLFLHSGVNQCCTQALSVVSRAPGPCGRPDQREATCGDKAGSIHGAATRMGALHSKSTGREAAAMHLQKQLDLFDDDCMFLERFYMLGRDHRRSGGALELAAYVLFGPHHTINRCEQFIPVRLCTM